MLRLVAPDGLLNLRRLPADVYVLGTERVFDLELLAVVDLSECRLATDEADWIKVSIDGGTTWIPVPAGPAHLGPNLGSMVAGGRTPIKLKVAIPLGTAVRYRKPRLRFGLGV